jgi:hypothetical protein
MSRVCHPLLSDDLTSKVAFATGPPSKANQVGQADFCKDGAQGVNLSQDSGYISDSSFQQSGNSSFMSSPEELVNKPPPDWDRTTNLAGSWNDNPVDNLAESNPGESSASYPAELVDGLDGIDSPIQARSKIPRLGFGGSPGNIPEHLNEEHGNRDLVSLAKEAGSSVTSYEKTIVPASGTKETPADRNRSNSRKASLSSGSPYQNSFQALGQKRNTKTSTPSKGANSRAKIGKKPKEGDKINSLACEYWRFLGSPIGHDCDQKFENPSKLAQHTRNKHHIHWCNKCLTLFGLPSERQEEEEESAPNEKWVMLRSNVTRANEERRWHKKHHNHKCPVCRTCCKGDKRPSASNHECDSSKKQDYHEFIEAAWQYRYEQVYGDGVLHNPCKWQISYHDINSSDRAL